MLNFDLTTRNAAIAILLFLNLLFLAVALLATTHPYFAAAKDDLWRLFYGTNASLFLALSLTRPNTPTPPPMIPVGA